jgi:hypothetical protein
VRSLLSCLALAALLGSGCNLLDDDYPDESCESDSDCFRAQGEICNTATRTCEPRADAGPTFDARPMPDAPPVPDAGPAPDADTTDAGEADAR